MVMKKYLLFIFILLSTIIFIGCNNQPEEPKLSISIIGPDEIYEFKIFTYKVEYSTEDEDIINKGVTWSTSDETVLMLNPSTGETELINVDEVTFVYIYAVYNGDNNIKAEKQIKINPHKPNTNPYPDLQGYTIKIASDSNIGLLNLNDGKYTEAKQRAFVEVSKLFNCNFEVSPYPETAEFGPSRWFYILEQSSQEKSDFDFLYVPEYIISKIAKTGYLNCLEDYYALYSYELMSKDNIKQGSYDNKLYAITNSQNDLGLAMFYNYDLFIELKKYDNSLEEPSQLFIEGNWDMNGFLNYCKKVQEIMKYIYGEKGTPLINSQEYYAISGLRSKWWTGLASNSGTPLLDVNTRQVDASSNKKSIMAIFIKDLGDIGIADFDRDEEYTSAYYNEKALFVVEEIDYDFKSNYPNIKSSYVPFPRYTEKLDDYKVSVKWNNQYIMPKYTNYDNFGDECNSENVYWAFSELLSKINKYIEEDNELITKTLQEEASNYCYSESSIESYLYIKNLISQNKYYSDPMNTVYSPIDDLYPDILGDPSTYLSIYFYCTDETQTWEELSKYLEGRWSEKVDTNYN